MRFRNKFVDRIYKFIYINDDQTILLKDIVDNLGISEPTVRKYLKWLEKRNLLKKNGKHFKLTEPETEE